MLRALRLCLRTIASAIIIAVTTRVTDAAMAIGWPYPRVVCVMLTWVVVTVAATDAALSIDALLGNPDARTT